MPARKTNLPISCTGKARQRLSAIQSIVAFLAFFTFSALLFCGCKPLSSTDAMASKAESEAVFSASAGPLESAPADGNLPSQFPAIALRVSDSLENPLVFSGSPEKVVALQASLADLWQIAGGTLVGVTKDASERGLSVGDAVIVGTTKHPTLERILSLTPDLVIYSPDIAGQAEAAEVLKQLDVPTYACKVDAFSDYLHHLEQFTVLTGHTDMYTQHGTALAEEIEAIKNAVPQTGNPPTVLFLRAYSSGVKVKATEHLACDILEDLAVDNIAARQPSLLEELSMEIIVKEDPDFILLAFMGEKDEKTMELLETTLFAQPAWQTLSAVKNGRLYELPTDLFHYKPNARWAESYQYLYDILYHDN